MKHLVFGQLAIWRITKNGTVIKDNLPGGNGLAGCAGARYAGLNPVPVTGIGADFEEHFSDWFERSEISTKGLFVRTDYCNYDMFDLDEDCPVAHSVLGRYAGMFNFAESVVYPFQATDLLQGYESALFCERIDQVSIDTMLAFGSKTSRVVWRAPSRMSVLPAECTVKTIQAVDAVAITQKICQSVFSVKSEEETIDCLSRFDKLILLITDRGYYALLGGNIAFSPRLRTWDGKELLKSPGSDCCAAAAALMVRETADDVQRVATAAQQAAAQYFLQYGPQITT